MGPEGREGAVTSFQKRAERMNPVNPSRLAVRTDFYIFKFLETT